MTRAVFKRKLAAILSADVKGYSRLMEEDEEATIRTITEYRKIITEQVKQHEGRVVDAPGDNVLAEFASVVDALKCAVQTQKEIAEQNENLPENRKMEFRIGVNLGDVAEERERIYGDGVNVAARIESLADPGGICISRTSYDQVRKKLSLGYEYLGEHSVKNIDEPVRVYRVLTAPEHAGVVIGEKTAAGKKWRRLAYAAVACLVVVAGGLTAWNIYLQKSKRANAAAIDKMAFPLPDKPSIAVLPFENISGDPEQEYFSDGITEDLITDLSKISGLFVIARNSVFIYKGRTIKIEEVGRELGVRHVLEGSVRKANGRIRITAQLVDATTEGHLWAERYDRDLKDIFTLQDEVTQKIVAALAVKLTEDEQGRLVRKYTDNMEAYDYYLRGLEYFSQLTKETNILARQMLQRAIDLDPQFAAAYALLGLIQSQEWTQGWSQHPHPLEHAFELAQKAIALDETLPLGYAIMAEVYLHKNKHEKAIAAQQKAIALSPNDADGIAGLGGILTWAGRPEETIELVKKAMRLNPMYPTEYLWNLGHAYYLMGRIEEAVETLNRARDRSPEYIPVIGYLAASYTELGQMEEAQTQAENFNWLNPLKSVEDWRHRLPYKDKKVTDRFISSCLKAGIK
jgi:TolB-like protein/class 3 adenylate cyclase